MSLLDLGLLVVGGAIGAVCRYWISRAGALVMPSLAFPAPTLFVNVTGSALLGLLFGLTDPDLTSMIDAPLLLLAGVGFCGAYTTFSSFCTETVTMVSKSPSKAALYVVLSVAGSVVALWLGVSGV